MCVCVRVWEVRVWEVRVWWVVGGGLTSENHFEKRLWLLISTSCPYAYLHHTDKAAHALVSS